MNARWIACLIVVIVGSGCFSKTHIYSRPAGASVTIDGTHPVGKTPIELDEQVWVWTKHNVTVAADGFAPQTIQIRSTGINYGYAVVCVCTLGLLFPLAMVSEYPDQYVVNLIPATPAAAEQPALAATPTVSFP